MCEVKPCPLCGGKINLCKKLVCGGHGFFYDEKYFYCPQCGFSFFPPGTAKTDLKKIEAFNNRHIAPSIKTNLYDKEDNHGEL